MGTSSDVNSTGREQDRWLLTPPEEPTRDPGRTHRAATGWTSHLCHFPVDLLTCQLWSITYPQPVLCPLLLALCTSAHHPFSGRSALPPSSPAEQCPWPHQPLLQALCTAAFTPSPSAPTALDAVLHAAVGGPSPRRPQAPLTVRSLPDAQPLSTPPTELSFSRSLWFFLGLSHSPCLPLILSFPACTGHALCLAPCSGPYCFLSTCQMPEPLSSPGGSALIPSGNMEYEGASKSLWEKNENISLF